MHFIVGLTGGIGSGKTVVSDYFADLGVPVIDTDVIARKIVEPGQAALLQLVEHFGDDILRTNGELNRDALRELAFADDASKARLDAITHPAIRLETIAQIRATRYPYCLVVVPLLRPDSEFSEMMQRILVVTARRETRIERVMKRSKLSRRQVEQIIATQLNEKQQLDFADDVVVNDGTIEDAQAQAEELHQKYLLFSQESAPS